MKVTILCGISGSGKSTLAEEIGGMVCSADDYFIKNGEYKFNPRSLPDAHATCLREYVEALQARVDRYAWSDMVVDNTNTTIAEIAPYAALALAYGCELLIKIVECDVETAVKRNIHGVPRTTIEAQATRIAGLKAALPPWWPCE